SGASRLLLHADAMTRPMTVRAVQPASIPVRQTNRRNTAPIIRLLVGAGICRGDSETLLRLTLFRGRGDAQIAEKPLRFAPNPQGDPARRRRLSQILDDEDRLRRAVDVERRATGAELDAQVRPLARFQIDVRLVDPGEVAAQQLPRKTWHR